MVRSAIGILLGLAAVGTIAGGTSAPLARLVTHVRIEGSGLSEHKDDYIVPLCTRFRLSTATVRSFFRRAEAVDSRVHTQERYSPCYLRGTLTLRDGRHGSWQLYSSRIATVQLSDGASYVLLCTECRWRDPFAGGYDGSEARRPRSIAR